MLAVAQHIQDTHEEFLGDLRDEIEAKFAEDAAGRGEAWHEMTVEEKKVRVSVAATLARFYRKQGQELP